MASATAFPSITESGSMAPALQGFARLCVPLGAIGPNREPGREQLEAPDKYDGLIVFLRLRTGKGVYSSSKPILDLSAWQEPHLAQ